MYMQDNMFMLIMRSSSNDIIFAPFPFEACLDTVSLVVFGWEGLVWIVDAFDSD